MWTFNNTHTHKHNISSHVVSCHSIPTESRRLSPPLKEPLLIFPLSPIDGLPIRRDWTCLRPSLSNVWSTNLFLSPLSNPSCKNVARCKVSLGVNIEKNVSLCDNNATSPFLTDRNDFLIWIFWSASASASVSSSPPSKLSIHIDPEIILPDPLDVVPLNAASNVLFPAPTSSYLFV